MNPQILHDYIVRPTLKRMGKKYNTKVARVLMMATSAQESHCGTYFKQVKGPALGIYQHEPETIKDDFKNFLDFNPKLAKILRDLQSPAGKKDSDVISVIGNLFYATGLARVHYYRFEEPLPDTIEFEGIWQYYKKYWNTDAGDATRNQFRDNFNRLVATVNFD